MGPRERTTPTRTCVGCGAKDARQALLRLARTEEGRLVLDSRARLPGRGAWVHASSGCLQRAEQPRAIGRAFRGKARAPETSLLSQAEGAGLRIDSIRPAEEAAAAKRPGEFSTGR